MDTGAIGEFTEKRFDPIFNPTYKKYEWKDLGYLGISYQTKPSVIPSTLGNGIGSLTSEFIGNTKGKEK